MWYSNKIRCKKSTLTHVNQKKKTLICLGESFKSLREP